MIAITQSDTPRDFAKHDIGNLYFVCSPACALTFAQRCMEHDGIVQVWRIPRTEVQRTPQNVYHMEHCINCHKENPQ
jgi:hypothetical protein